MKIVVFPAFKNQEAMIQMLYAFKSAMI